MKLSKRLSKRLAFVASKMALSIDQDERMALLTELLDELGITDAEQRADSKESAARHLRYTAQQRRKAERQADDIDNMKRDELQDYIKQLYAKRDALLAERAKRPDIDAMSDEERAAYQQHLMRSIADKMEPSAPEPAPAVEEAPQYDLPTRRMEKAVARFDDMSDEQQLDVLGQMWGCTDGQ